PAPRRAPAPPADEPWPGAPVGERVRTVPPVSPGTGAAARAYGHAAPPKGFVDMSIEDAGKLQTVKRLAAEGLSAAEIARPHRIEREEVELILQLTAGNQP